MGDSEAAVNIKLLTRGAHIEAACLVEMSILGVIKINNPGYIIPPMLPKSLMQIE